MVNRAKPTRLWLRKRAGRPATWVIRDGHSETSTGCLEGDIESAEIVLQRYLDEHKQERLTVPPRPQKPPSPTIIYFISTDDVPDYPIKIGISTEREFRWRLGSLQTACPYRLRALAVVPGNLTNERHTHIEFAGHRLQGEWFKRCPELLELIASLAQSEAA